jgi:hypothetical protein
VLIHAPAATLGSAVPHGPYAIPRMYARYTGALLRSGGAPV